MFLKRRRAYLPGLALAAYLILLSGCGRIAPSRQASQAAPSNTQDQVRITIDQAVFPDKQGEPGKLGELTVTLTNVSLTHQLYATLVALPPPPQYAVCLADAGPSYTLTFLRGGKTQLTATAQRYGCHFVSIVGEKQDRQASQTFWSQLDQAIYQATPPAIRRHPAPGAARSAVPDRTDHLG